MKRLLCAVLLSACASGPELPKSQAPTHADAAQVQTLLDKADVAFKQINKKSDMEPVMMMYEDIIKLAPDHRDALVRGAALYYYRGADVLAKDAKDKREQAHLRGRELGLRAMALNPEFRGAYEKDSDMVKQLQLLKADDAPAAYWAALNWAKWGELHGIISAAIDIPKVKAMMEFVQKNAPSYYGNAADRFFIGYWVAIPGFAGKDPKKAKAAFDKATKESPQCLSNWITLAEYYARDVEDRALFDSAIKRVMEAPAEPTDSQFRLLNGIAKEEAPELMAHAKEWFE